MYVFVQCTFQDFGRQICFPRFVANLALGRGEWVIKYFPSSLSTQIKIILCVLCKIFIHSSIWEYIYCIYTRSFQPHWVHYAFIKIVLCIWNFQMPHTLPECIMFSKALLLLHNCIMSPKMCVMLWVQYAVCSSPLLRKKKCSSKSLCLTGSSLLKVMFGDRALLCMVVGEQQVIVMFSVSCQLLMHSAAIVCTRVEATFSLTVSMLSMTLENVILMPSGVVDNVASNKSVNRYCTL